MKNSDTKSQKTQKNTKITKITKNEKSKEKVRKSLANHNAPQNQNKNITSSMKNARNQKNPKIAQKQFQKKIAKK